MFCYDLEFHIIPKLVKSQGNHIHSEITLEITKNNICILFTGICKVKQSTINGYCFWFNLKVQAET